MFEKEAKEWVTANTGFKPKEPFGKIAVRTYLAGLKAGIAKLRYCCTCKKWKERKVVSMYGICADWEIEEYLAWLKAGRIQWHNVADGDLPKNDGFVCNQNGLLCRFDIRTDQWFDCEGTQIRTTEWCYMPHFSDFHK